MLTAISRFVAVSLLTAFTFGIPLRSVADEKEKEGAPAKSDAGAREKRQSRFPFRGRIVSVDTAGKTITIEGKEKNRVIHITSQTKILKAGKAATLEEATAGEQVAGQVSRSAEGREEASSIRLGAKPETAPKRSKAEEK